MSAPTSGSDERTPESARHAIQPHGVPPDLGARLRAKPDFSSPMPTIATVETVTPLSHAVLAGLAAFASVAFAVLLFLKR